MKRAAKGIGLWALAVGIGVAGGGARAESDAESTGRQVASAAEGANAASLAGAAGTSGFARWQTYLSSESWMSAGDRKAFGSEAPLISQNSVGLLYNFSPVWALELRECFEYASHREHLDERGTLLHQRELEVGPTALRLTAKPSWGLAGSKPVTAELRYYLPNDRLSRELNGRGLIRGEAYAEWMLTPRISGALWASPRILLNSSENPNAAKGADAEYYQLKLAPYANYYFNDNLSLYYAFTWDGRSSEAQRGDWTPDVSNDGSHEVGLYWTAGDWIVNPALLSYNTLNSREGSLFTSDSRVFAEETLVYALNIYGTF